MVPEERNPQEVIRDFGLSYVQKRIFDKGSTLFNEHQYWEAHEAWEEVWREKTGEVKLLLQGLIQAAAACHLIYTAPRYRGAVRNIEKSLSKLDQCPDLALGIDVARLRGELRSAKRMLENLGADRIGEFPEKMRPRL